METSPVQEQSKKMKKNRSPSSLRRSKERMKLFINKKKLLSIIPEEQNVKEVRVDELIDRVQLENFTLKQKTKRQGDMISDLVMFMADNSQKLVESIVKHHNSELQEKDQEILGMTNTIQEQEEYIQQQINQLDHAETIIQQHESDLDHAWDIIKDYEQEIRYLKSQLDSFYLSPNYYR